MNLFGSQPKVETPVKATIPDDQDPAVIAARRRPYEEAAAASGRASTILSSALAPYGSTKLGTMK